MAHSPAEIETRTVTYLREHGWMSLRDIRDDLDLSEVEIELCLQDSQRISRGHYRKVGSDVAWLKGRCPADGEEADRGRVGGPIMSWQIETAAEESGWRWWAREPGTPHYLTGWEAGTRYNAECGARNKIQCMMSLDAASSAIVLDPEPAS